MGRCCRLPLIKALEITLTVTCFTLHVFSLQPADEAHITLLSVTFITFLVIEVGVAFGAVSGTPVPSVVDALYSVLGAGMFLASGVASLRFWDDEPRELQVVRLGLWKGVVSSVASVIFVLDAFLAIQGSNICAGEPFTD